MSAFHGALPDPRARIAASAQHDLHDDWLLLEQLSAAILVLDPNGSIVHLNAPAEQRLGRSARELVGRHLFGDVLRGLEAEGLRDRFRAAMQGSGSVQLWQATLPEHAAAPHAVSLAVRSFRRQEHLFGLVTIEEPSRPADVEDQRELLEHLAVVGELTGGVAHQINNPLASIKGFAQLLARESVSAEHRGALEIIEKECSRITRIIDNLLHFARPETLGQRLPVDLNVLVERTLALQEYALTTTGIAVERDLAPELSQVLAEPSALQRVLLALLYHAERVLSHHPGTRRVTIRTRESTTGVVLCVQDSGPGMSRDDLLAMLQTEDSSAAAGCLSLAAAARIVGDHRGEVWAETAPGKGTSVYLRFPRHAAAAAPAPVRLAVQRDEPSSETQGTPVRLRVLVADDEPMLQLALSHYLERFGHQVASAKDVGSALRLAAEQHFDVALVDVRMPGDGLILLEQLEEMPGLRNRTIVMSGDPRQARLSTELHDRPFLGKPFDMAEALKLIERVGR